ncbi:UNVERIFIED_CONTAM: hypothetical protein FKN15_011356 [Acipenser sinensis]
MAAVRSLQVSVKPDIGSDRSESDSESEPDRDPREPEPMEVEEGELESISVQRSLKDLLPDTSRRYENKAGTFITGIDVTSKEAVEKKDQRAKRFHLRAEENLTQRNVVLDRETIKKDLVNVPEEPIEEEEEEEEEDMDEDERVVEYREERERERGARSTMAPLRRPSPPDLCSDSDEMDYDLELKMISTPSPKKSMKMTMYADEVESKLKTIRNSMRSDTVVSSNVKNRIGSGSKTSSETVTDVRLLLEEKRQNSTQQHPSSSTTKTDVRQRLGKRPHSPDSRAGKVTVISPAPVPRREPLSDVHSRLGTPRQDPRGLYSENSKDKKPAGNLWSRLGSSSSRSLRKEKPSPRKAVAARGSSGSEKEEDDSELQRVWGNLIKEKKEKEKEQSLKKSRLDNLPSLQIEISRDSSNGSDSES